MKFPTRKRIQNHIYNINYWGNYVQAICEKCNDQITAEQSRKTLLKNVKHSQPYYSATGEYYCVTRNTIKLLVVENKVIINEKKLDPCLLSDNDYVVMDILK